MASSNKVFINTQRKLWIDELRGIAMLLVIYGHFAKTWNNYFVFTSPIKIPLFFAITGYCFSFKDGNVKKWIHNILTKLVLPWVVLSLVWLKIPYAIIRGDISSCSNYILQFISGDTLWYMPCCIWAEIIHFTIRKNSKKYSIEIFMTVLATILGFVLAYLNIGNFMRMNTALIAQSFIMIGVLLRDIKVKAECRNLLVLGVLFYILLGLLSIFLYPGTSIDVHKNSYYNIVVVYGMIFLGISVLFILFSQLKRTSKVLIFIGQNTLVYYMLNPYAWKLVRKCLDLLNVKLMENLVGYAIQTVTTCMMCAVIAIIINNCFPEIMGKQRNKQIKS